MAKPDEAAEALISRFVPRAPLFAFEDVVLPEAARRDVASLLAKIERHRTLFDTWNLKKLEPQGRRLVVNLYGLPGTGKTMLAEAIAKRLGKQILEISYAEIESKYVGDTPKNIVAAFNSAARNGCAIFFDEADSILGRRMTHVTAAADHGVNVSRAVMLKELDRFDGIVIFATNLARNFDSAFVRRILYHIEIPPPDEAGRKLLWTRMIPDEIPGRARLDFDELARASERLVGGEIKNAVLQAATSAVQRDGTEQSLTIADLLRAIEHTRRAKQEVGQRELATAESEIT